MGTRLPYTPNSKIKHALRSAIWLRSRERSKALQNTNYCCAYCGRKQSKAKGKELTLDVHHLDGCKWQEAIDAIRKYILQTPDRLAPVCKECHDKQHAKDQEKDDA